MLGWILNLGFAGGAVDVEAVVPEAPSGGFFFDFDALRFKRDEERKRLEALREKAEKLQEKLDREIALEFRKKEEDEIKIDQLNQLDLLLHKHKAEMQKSLTERVILTAERALKQGNFSAIQALDRELRQAKEEEEFLIQAFQIIVNQ